MTKLDNFLFHRVWNGNELPNFILCLFLATFIYVWGLVLQILSFDYLLLSFWLNGLDKSFNGVDWLFLWLFHQFFLFDHWRGLVAWILTKYTISPVLFTFLGLNFVLFVLFYLIKVFLVYDRQSKSTTSSPLAELPLSCSISSICLHLLLVSGYNSRTYHDSYVVLVITFLKYFCSWDSFWLRYPSWPSWPSFSLPYLNIHDIFRLDLFFNILW